MSKLYLYILLKSFICLSILLEPLCSYSQKLIAYFPLNKTAEDLSPNRNNGFIFGSVTPTADRFNDPCGAMYFDGRTGFIQVPSSPSLESIQQTFTFTAWYKLDNTSENLQWLTVFCKGQNSHETLDNPQYRFQVQQSSSLTTQSCRNGMVQNGFSTISINSPITECDYMFKDHLFRVGEWHFYAITYDGKVLTAFMDDMKVWEGSYSFTLNASTSPLFIGMDEPGSTEFHKGALDDIRIYSEALSHQQLSDIYHESRKALPKTSTTFPSNQVITLSAFDCTATLKLPPYDTGCNIAVVRQISGPPNNSQVGRGNYRITTQITRLDGSVEQRTFFIEVRDVTPPAITKLKDTTILVSAGDNGKVVQFATPVTTDCGSVEVTTTSKLKSGDFFPIGSHVITFSAIDESHNTTFSSFVITVKNKQAQRPSTDTSIKVAIRKASLDSVPTSKKEPDLRKKEEQRRIYVESDSITVMLLDNAQLDDDTVSVYVNGDPVLFRIRLTNKAQQFKVALDPKEPFYDITMFAENLGTIPPNTSLMVIYDGQKKYEINLTSTLEKSGTVRILKKHKLK